MAVPEIAGNVDDDPCAALHERVVDVCADALRLAELAGERAAELRRERHTGAQLERRAEDTRLAGSGALAQAKNEAYRRYRDMRRRPGTGASSAAVLEWLREIDRLNRNARTASPGAPASSERRGQNEASLVRLTLAADAARIAAGEAAEKCQAERIRLAACREHRAGAASEAVVEPDSAIVALLHGDQDALAALTEQAERTSGLSATEGRRLLSLLAAALTDGALEHGSLVFSPENGFWRQFPAGDARRIASVLAGLGNGFDGRGGWTGGHGADSRLLATALAHVGYDARGVRQPANAAEMETLWRGTAVDAVGHLLGVAPDLSLENVVRLVGPRAAALGALWDRWGSLRPLLLAPYRSHDLRR